MKRFLFYFLFLIVPLLLSGCARTNQWAKSVQWKEFSLDSTPGAEKYPDAGAIILLDEGEMSVTTSKELAFSTFIQHTIIKILNERGRKFANVIIPYSSKTRVTDIKARTISPSGKITVLNKNHIFDVNLYPSFIFYSDVRAKTFTLPAVENGCIVEYSYTKTIGDLIYWNSWTFQNEEPTLISRYTLIIPSEWDFHSSTYHIDIQPQVTKYPTGFKATYIWEVRNVPGLVTEPAMPPINDVVCQIAFSPAFVNNWNDIGRWYQGLAEDRMKPTQEIEALAKDLVAGAETEYEKLQRIFDFVQRKIRYVAIEIGIGGYQPHFAAETLTNRYGDCKDMTTLIVAMANALGITAYPVLVSTHQNGQVDTSLASQTQFNHAIAYAPLSDGQGVWMDATDKACPFGQLPWYDQGIDVLVIKKDGQAQFMKTPLNRPEDNLTEHRWQLQLDSTGAVAGVVYIKLTGSPGISTRREVMQLRSSHQKLWLSSYLSTLCHGASLDSFSISPLYELETPLTIDAYFHAPQFAVPEEDWLILEGGFFDRPVYEAYFSIPERTHPVLFKYLQKNVDQVQIILPKGFKVKNLPKSETLSSALGKLETSYYLKGEVLEHSRIFEMTQLTIRPDQYAEFREFLQKVSRKDREKILLGK